jgi:hypothetical protein
MILAHCVDGGYVPVLVCDICEKRIVDAQLGAVVFKRLVASEPDLIPGLHVHKGECHNAAESRLGGRENTGWMELQTHLLYLVLNSKLTPEMLAAERDMRDAAGEWPK